VCDVAGGGCGGVEHGGATVGDATRGAPNPSVCPAAPYFSTEPSSKPSQI
jgi:hypothetical protein